MVAELTRHVWCDVCTNEGTQAPAEVEQVIRLGDADPVQVDLCESHRAGLLAELEGWLAMVGRTPDAVVAARPRRGRPPSEKSLREPCPVCGLDVTAGSLRRHIRQVHNTEPPPSRRNATTGEFLCPECGATYNRPQGLGVHRKTAHGVEGESVAARYARIAKREAR